MGKTDLFFAPLKCQKCKGVCRVEGDSAQTQKNARAFFEDGIHPHNCIDSNSGQVFCPYAKK